MTDVSMSDDEYDAAQLNGLATASKRPRKRVTAMVAQSIQKTRREKRERKRRKRQMLSEKENGLPVASFGSLRRLRKSGHGRQQQQQQREQASGPTVRRFFGVREDCLPTRAEKPSGARAGRPEPRSQRRHSQLEEHPEARLASHRSLPRDPSPRREFGGP